MKGLLLTIALLSANAAITLGQAQRRILFEEFTQASCAPCAAQNPAYNALLGSIVPNSNTPKVVNLKYQVWWPGNDPMHEQNSEDVHVRTSYYNVGGVPDVYMDGSVREGVAPNTITQSVINDEYAVASPIGLTLSHTWSADADSIFITVSLHNVSGSDYGTANHRLHVLLAEKTIRFSNPPGSNGETRFYGVVRKMYPSANGAAFSIIPAGDTYTVQYAVAVPNYIYNLNELAVAAFVQNNTDKKVDNAAWSDPVPLPSNLLLLDVSALALTEPLSGYCDYELIPTIAITNKSNNALGSLKAYYAINGGAAVEQAITGIHLANGQSDTIAFAPTMVPAGLSTVSYWVSHFNYANSPSIDTNLVDNNMPDQTCYTLSDTAVGTSIQEGFDGLVMGTDAPNHAILVNPARARVFVVDGNAISPPLADLGGFGLSNTCYCWDYWAMGANVVSSLLFDKIDLSSKSDAVLTFSHAHCQYATENDRLEVLVSGDCGATWTSVFNKAGASLSTAAADPTTRFYPRPNEWVGDTLDLSAFDGMSEVTIQFKGTSMYGNSLYIDDINLFSIPVSAQQPTPLDGLLHIYPNPAQHEVNIALNLEQGTDTQCFIYNTLGQQVYSMNSKASAGQNTWTLDVSHWVAGLYQLNLMINGRIQSQQIIITK